MMAVRIVRVGRWAADAETAALAADYLLCSFGDVSQFAMVAMGIALRGTGNFKPGD